MADILTVALSWAIGFTILSEVLGPVVLLIPKAVKRIKAVGREEGIAEERKAQSNRYRQASQRIVVDADGNRTLEITPEIEELLSGQSAE